jgi:hypothetical protein
MHTPGPWEAPRNGLDGAVYAPNAPKGTLWRITDGVRGQSHEELAANARLIAAAPALLAALEQTVRALEGECLNDTLNPCWNDRPTDVIGSHWGVGSACAVCTARAIIAEVRRE